MKKFFRDEICHFKFSNFVTVAFLSVGNIDWSVSSDNVYVCGILLANSQHHWLLFLTIFGDCEG